MVTKSKKGEGILKYLRDANTNVKKSILEQNQSESNILIPERGPFKPKIFNVMDYIESDWGLKIKLFPAQRVIVKTYYGIELNDKDKDVPVKDMFNTKTLYEFTEAEYLQFLYNEGRCNIKELDHSRTELVLSIGRRSGKTLLSSIFASYELYRLLNLHNPQAYYGFPNGNVMQLISIATDKEQASILFNEVTGHLAKCDYFNPFIVNNTLSEIKIRSPYDIDKFGPNLGHHQNGKFVSFNGKISLKVTFKSSTAKGLRGHSNAVVILDELAHYIETGESSAEKIYDAVTPSTATYTPKDPETRATWKKEDGSDYPLESRVISISSPLNKFGKFYQLYQLGMSNGPGSENMLCFKAPTWEINPTVSSSYYKQRFHANSVTFMTEHGAEFSDQIRAWITREEDLLNCVNPTLRPFLKGGTRVPHFMGIDIGLVGDSCSICLTTVDPLTEKIRLVYHEMWTAGEDWRETNSHLGPKDYSIPYCALLATEDRIDFEQIANWVEALTKRFYVQEGMFDRWNGIPLEQALRKKGIGNINSVSFSPDLKSKIYQATMLMLLDYKIELYDWPCTLDPTGKVMKHSPQIEEFLKLQAEQRSNNIVIVAAPSESGNHDDWSDSYVRANWLAIEHMSQQKTFGKRTHNPYARAPIGTLQAHQRRKTKMRGNAYVNQRPHTPRR